MAVSTEQLQRQFRKPGMLDSITVFDWIYMVLGVAAIALVYYQYGHAMDAYEIPIFAGVATALIALGVMWKPFKKFALFAAAVSLLAVGIYAAKLPQLAKEGITGRDAISVLSTKATHDPAKAAALAKQQQATGQAVVTPKRYNFFLTYLIASKVAVMWMSALFILATVFYFVAMGIAYVSKTPHYMENGFMARSASGVTWAAAIMGMVAWLVRWRESYIVGADVGHIPVSNLYEVFIVLCVFSALIYLYFEGRFKTKSLGGFVLLIITASVLFTLWYHFQGQHRIEGLIPALQSWWMKIHVPANFVGYASFSIAAMISIPYLYKLKQEQRTWRAQHAAQTAGTTTDAPAPQKSLLPSIQTMDSIMYKSIAFGWIFFSIATALGAFWAKDAWGAYWQWDPKETWALIVWINYAAWLHFRLIMGVRGAYMAIWAIVGLFVTTFAFLGVNIVLSGLHSYGGLGT